MSARPAAPAPDELTSASSLLDSARLQLLGALTSGVTHEINAPLATVLTNLDVVLERLGELDVPADEIRSLVDALIEARAGVDRVSDSVQCLRQLSAAPSPTPEPVDLAEAVTLAVSLAGHQVRHRARLEVIHEEPARGIGTVQQIAQLVAHLLMHAVDTLDDGSAASHRVQVRIVGARQGRVRIEISDTADTLTMPATRPAGRDLDAARELCSRLGGRLTLRHDSGQGVTRVVDLLGIDAESPALTPVRRSASAGASRRGRVLVADDDPLVRIALRRALERHHEVRTVESGRDALSVLDEDPAWDVIVCDVMMPDLNGRQLHSTLLSRRPRLAARMIFVTGGAFTAENQAFLATIDNPVIDKPFRIRELRELISAAVALSPMLDDPRP